MIYNFVYKNLKTGEKVYSNVQLNNPDLKIVSALKRVVMNRPVLAKKKSIK